MQIFKILFLVANLTMIGCSGGGGGGDNAGKEGDEGVTTKSAVRIIHSSIDSVPMGVSSNGVFLGESSYLGKNKFYNVGIGANQLTLTRSSRVSEPLLNLPLEVQDKVEYSIFLYGSQRDRDFNAKILVEPVIRPEKGMSRFQVLNGLSDTSAIKFSISTNLNQNVPFGDTSGFIDVPSGTYDVTVSGATGGSLGVVSVTLPEQGEITLVVSGKLEYSFLSMKTYQDFD